MQAYSFETFPTLFANFFFEGISLFANCTLHLVMNFWWGRPVEHCTTVEKAFATSSPVRSAVHLMRALCRPQLTSPAQAHQNPGGYWILHGGATLRLQAAWRPCFPPSVCCSGLYSGRIGKRERQTPIHGAFPHSINFGTRLKEEGSINGGSIRDLAHSICGLWWPRWEYRRSPRTVASSTLPWWAPWSPTLANELPSLLLLAAT